MKKIIFFLEYCFCRVLCFFLRLIPLRAGYRIAELAGTFAFRVLGIRKRIMLDNLRFAFGNEKSEEELFRIAEQSMQNLIKLAFEFIATPRVVKNPAKYIETPNPDFVAKLMGEGKGAIAIVSHFGNWEWLAIPIRPFGLFTNAVGRPFKNPYLYDYVRKLRETANLRNIEKSGAVRASINVIRKGEMVALLIDQHEARGAVWVDFFGRKASTSTLPAMLALKYDCPVFPAFFYRDESERSRVFYGPEFKLIKTGNLQKDLLANTQQYVAKIEEEIRKRPGDWLWAHRRWRLPR